MSAERVMGETHPAPVYLLCDVLDAIGEYNDAARREGKPTFPLDAAAVIRRSFRKTTDEYRRQCNERAS